MSVFEINGQGLCGKNEDDLINKWALLQLSAFFFFLHIGIFPLAIAFWPAFVNCRRTSV